MSDDPDDVDKLLDQMEKAAALDAASNYRVMDNHLKHTDRVIANVAALKNINDDGSLLKALAENPT